MLIFLACPFPDTFLLPTYASHSAHFRHDVSAGATDSFMMASAKNTRKFSFSLQLRFHSQLNLNSQLVMIPEDSAEFFTANISSESINQCLSTTTNLL